MERLRIPRERADPPSGSPSRRGIKIIFLTTPPQSTRPRHVIHRDGVGINRPAPPLAPGKPVGCHLAKRQHKVRLRVIGRMRHGRVDGAGPRNGTDHAVCCGTANKPFFPTRSRRRSHHVAQHARLRIEVGAELHLSIRLVKITVLTCRNNGGPALRYLVFHAIHRRCRGRPRVQCHLERVAGRIRRRKSTFHKRLARHHPDLNRSRYHLHTPGGPGPCPQLDFANPRIFPFDAVKNRFPVGRCLDEKDLRNPDLLFVRIKLHPIDVSLRILGNGIHRQRLGAPENLSVPWRSDHDASIGHSRVGLNRDGHRS